MDWIIYVAVVGAVSGLAVMVSTFRLTPDDEGERLLSIGTTVFFVSLLALTATEVVKERDQNANSASLATIQSRDICELSETQGKYLTCKGE